MAQHYTYSEGIVYTPTLLSAITEDTTSIAQLCAGAKKIGFILTEGGTVNNRSGVFTVTVSLDGGTTYHAYSMLISNATNTNAQNLTRVASVTRAAAGSDVIWMTPETLTFTHLKVAIDVTDGDSPTGNYTVKAVIVY